MSATTMDANVAPNVNLSPQKRCGNGFLCGYFEGSDLPRQTQSMKYSETVFHGFKRSAA